MTRPLVFHPDVEDEVREAYRWYESRQSGLGDDFLAALEELLGFVILLAWSLFLGLGIGGAAFLAERAVGRRPEAAPGQTHGRHAGWHRPKGAEEGS